MRYIDYDVKRYEEYGITGTLTLRVPTYRERLRIMKECNLTINENGVVKKNSDMVDNVISLLDSTQPFFEKIDLKCGNIEVKTYEEMESYSEFDLLISDASAYLLNVGKLGK